MLKEASDYTYVDVSNIAVKGDILPARDMSGIGTGAWRVLKAEDAAYLLEMIAERNGQEWPGRTPLLVLDNLWYVIAVSADSRSGYVVDTEYEFEEKYDVSVPYDIRRIHADAFNYKSSAMATEVTGDPYGAYKRKLDSDFIRRAYYDFSRKTAFLYDIVNPYSSSCNPTFSYEKIASQYNESSERVDTNTTPQSGYKYGWSALVRPNDTCYTSVQYKNNSGTADIIPSNFSIDTKFIESVIIFVKVECAMTENNQSETHTDIIPVSCDKVGDVWRIPSSVFTDATARRALNMYGFPPDPPSVTKTPDGYNGGGTRKEVSVELYIGEAVVYCKFPSDFSELGWGWEP